MIDKKLFIGSLVRDRGWVLEYFLDHINKINYSKRQIDICWFLNDSRDNSKELVTNFKNKYEHLYGSINIIEKKYGNPKNERVGRIRRRLYESLAYMRNLLIDEFLKTDCQYYFSIDCDILVEPNILNELIIYATPMASAIISNDVNSGSISIPNIMRYVPNQKTFKRINALQDQHKVIPCDLSGAAILFKRKFLEQEKYRYHFHGMGEDAGLHFITAKENIKINSVRNLATHIMSQEALEKWKIESAS